MGYYSNYEYDGDYLTDEIEDRLVKISQYSNEHIFKGAECKWYDMYKDIAQLTKEFPNILMSWQCQGEDGEQWRVYAKNGKTCDINPVVTYAKFNESMLEEK